MRKYKMEEMLPTEFLDIVRRMSVSKISSIYGNYPINLEKIEDKIEYLELR